MDLHVKVGVSPIQLLKCTSKNCTGNGRIEADYSERVDIRLGQNKVQDIKFSCGHTHRVVLEN